MSYDFAEQLHKGERYEEYLDGLFSPRYVITPASDQEQRQGIDRHYANRRIDERFTVQYKADEAACRTGNAFVETVSVDARNVPGWAYSSKADYLFYLICGDGSALYIIRFVRLRRHLKRWIQTCQTREIPNADYCTVGLLVPLAEFEACAEAVVG